MLKKFIVIFMITICFDINGYFFILVSSPPLPPPPPVITSRAQVDLYREQINLYKTQYKLYKKNIAKLLWINLWGAFNIIIIPFVFARDKEERNMPMEAQDRNKRIYKLILANIGFFLVILYMK